MATGGHSYSTFLQRARASATVDKEALDLVVAGVAQGRVSDSEGANHLRMLLEGEALPNEVRTAAQADVEWEGLMRGMQEEADDWKRIARGQYRQGYWLFPVALLLVLSGTVFSIWLLQTPTTTVTTLAGASIADLAAH